MHFLSFPLLGGLVLASIPFIIHLLNRRRFQVIDWAPMKYLKLTIKTNRRRLRIEQLLLLIIRTLVIVLLFLAISRPILSRGGGLLVSRARTSRFLVIDDSLSMGYQQDHRSAFDNAKDAASQILHSIGAQDSLTTVLTSSMATPLVREATLSDPNKLLAQIDDVQPADSATRWSSTFKQLDDLLNTATFPQKEVVVITDLRRSGWDGSAASEITQLANQWAQKSVSLKIIDVGSRKIENVSLARFEQEDPIALPGVPLRLRASVRNDTLAGIAGAQATLSVDGDQRPILLPNLPAAQTIEIPLAITPSKPGPIAVSFLLPPDNLPGDNRRWLSINTRPRLDLLLVDGSPGAGPFESATDFLHVAFTIGADPWQVQRLDDAAWQSAHPNPADVMVLANVASITTARAKELEQLVSDGMGLMLFAGEQVDPQLYNQRLFRDGQGLLPAEIDRIVDGPVNGLVVEGFDDSPLATLAKVAPGALSRIKPKRFLAVVPPPPDAKNVRVLARWNDAESHPAVIEKRFGKGRVLLWTVSADRQWSDWPVDPTYVLATRSAAVAIARPDANSDNITAGQPIDFAIDQTSPAIDPRIASPEANSPEPLTSQDNHLRHDQTRRAGTYVISWKDALGKDQSHSFCASPDPAESNLEPISEEQLAQVMGTLRPSILHYSPGDAPVTDAGKEIWRTLATLMLILAATETAMAVWVGRER